MQRGIGRNVGLDDEVLDLDQAAGTDTRPLTGESALFAALTASRTGRMRDIVETIQAEQDLVIRSELGGVLVVQGGPGTGKTAVALHRAAYLLYTYRRQLGTRGVLIVGPNPLGPPDDYAESHRLLTDVVMPDLRRRAAQRADQAEQQLR